MSKPVDSRPWRLLGKDDEYINPDYAPAHLLDLTIRTPRTVLDVGCFAGAMGRTVKTRFPNAQVIGIEPRASAAAQAREHLDLVVQGLFEDFDFTARGFSNGRIDTVILADVLEHMYDPWQVLRTLRRHMASDGQLLVSIPNLRNLYILSELAAGRFDYEREGILDITHIRFFTRSGIMSMFQDSGFSVPNLAIVRDPRCDSLRDPAVQQSGTVDTGSLRLSGLSREDQVELAALQFIFAAVPVSTS